MTKWFGNITDREKYLELADLYSKLSLGYQQSTGTFRAIYGIAAVGLLVFLYFGPLGPATTAAVSMGILSMASLNVGFQLTNTHYQTNADIQYKRYAYEEFVRANIHTSSRV